MLTSRLTRDHPLTGLESFCFSENIADCWATITSPAAESIPAKAGECVFRFLGLCFITPAAPTAKVFGFAEFVQAFALLVVIYTVSDVRYRFRIEVASFPLWGWTFVTSALIGGSTLFVDFWFGNRLPVPRFIPDQTYVQVILGAMFLLTVVAWLWIAFMRPPVFGRRNAQKYAQALYRYVVRGSQTELPQIASELGRSAHSIVTIASNKEANDPWSATNSQRQKKPAPWNYAHDVMLLIADRKLCRVIVAEAPGSAMAIFGTVTREAKYGLPLGLFASNLTTEALLNKDSILYHEGDEFRSGLLGFAKPFSKTLYGDFRLMEYLTPDHRSPLDIDYRLTFKWDAEQVTAYGKAVLTALEAYLTERRWGHHSGALARAFNHLDHGFLGLHTLDELTGNAYESDPYRRLSAVADFATETIKLLSEHKDQITTTLRYRGEHRFPHHHDLTDEIVNLLLEMFLASTQVRSANFLTWDVQHNTAWSSVFTVYHTPVFKIIRFKLRRLLYDTITHDTKRLDFKSARLLGFCLNVMGLTVGNRHQYGKESYALRKVILAWTTRNYMTFRARAPHVADAVLMGRLTFDKENRRLVKTYERGLSRMATREFLPLDPPRLTRKAKSRKVDQETDS